MEKRNSLETHFIQKHKFVFSFHSSSTRSYILLPFVFRTSSRKQRSILRPSHVSHTLVDFPLPIHISCTYTFTCSTQRMIMVNTRSNGNAHAHAGCANNFKTLISRGPGVQWLLLRTKDIVSETVSLRISDRRFLCIPRAPRPTVRRALRSEPTVPRELKRSWARASHFSIPNESRATRILFVAFDSLCLPPPRTLFRTTRFPNGRWTTTGRKQKTKNTKTRTLYVFRVHRKDTYFHCNARTYPYSGYSQHENIHARTRFRSPAHIGAPRWFTRAHY